MLISFPIPVAVFLISLESPKLSFRSADLSGSSHVCKSLPTVLLPPEVLGLALPLAVSLLVGAQLSGLGFDPSNGEMPFWDSVSLTPEHSPDTRSSGLLP